MIEEKNKKSADKARPMALTIKAVVLNDKNEVLILKRSKKHRFNPGKFDIPGGHIEENESLRDSVLREIKEETGLEAIFGEIIDVVEFAKDHPLFLEEKRGIRCICYVSSSEVVISPEHESYEWVAFEKAAEKFSEKDGFENEKRNTILKAKEYLELKKSKDSWMRCSADFDNYKKDQTRQMEDFRNFTKSDFILQVLPVLDNFHASTKHIPEDQKKSPWVEGIMHIQKQLEQVLKDNGVEEIEVKVGDEFNPEIHEAIADAKLRKEFESTNDNLIKKIMQKGYKINNKVIRAAKVIVE